MPLLTGPAIAAGRLARSPQPVLRRNGVLLRPWHLSDTQAVAQAYDDPDIRRWHARSMTAHEAHRWIDSWAGPWQNENGAGWAVVDEAAVLGQISLRRLSLADGLGELSYWVLPAARGNRVATRALGALSAWAFGQLHLHRLEVLHSTLNPASCRVAANAGFVLEGTKRSEALHLDGWHDMHLHARLIDDPRPALSEIGCG